MISTADEHGYTQMESDCLVQFLGFPQFWADRAFVQLSRRMLRVKPGHPEISSAPSRFGPHRSPLHPRQSAFIRGCCFCVSLHEILFVSIRVYSRFLLVSVRGYETVFS